jgi:hypothetical protein
MLDYLYAFAFVAALASPLVYFAVIWRKWPKVGIVSAVVYVLSYGVLTLSGGYAVANHGGSDWRREWHPKFLMIEYVAPSGRTKSDITFVGAFCWPCIVIDRFVWHRTSEADV